MPRIFKSGEFVFLIFVILSMLEFKKRILLKVSFDLVLFEKELRKAFQWLNGTDLEHLKIWCYTNFSDLYTVILDKVFINEKIVSAKAK
jgi:hypothetical protein